MCIVNNLRIHLNLSVQRSNRHFTCSDENLLNIASNIIYIFFQKFQLVYSGKDQLVQQLNLFCIVHKLSPMIGLLCGRIYNCNFQVQFTIPHFWHGIGIQIVIAIPCTKPYTAIRPVPGNYFCQPLQRTTISGVSEPLYAT